MTGGDRCKLCPLNHIIVVVKWWGVCSAHLSFLMDESLLHFHIWKWKRVRLVVCVGVPVLALLGLSDDWSGRDTQAPPLLTEYTEG